MPRAKRLKKKRALLEQLDPRSMAAQVPAFLEWMQVRNYAERTVENNRRCLGYFIAWCEERGVGRVAEVTRPILERYQRHVYHYRHPKSGKPLSFRSQCVRLSPVRSFFKYLARQHVILYNPAAELEFPRGEKRLPRHVLSAAEAEQVMNQTDVASRLGIRDRAILETFYSTGMRRMELIRLSLYDLDSERGTVLIRCGKGKKDRVIPIGERALLWCEKYIHEVRPSILVDSGEGTLFLNNAGRPYSPKRMTELVHHYIDQATITKQGACHLFRHTMATLMLEGGADIRFIQAMLGHENLETTEIYTRVSIRKLKEVHSKTHPARMGRLGQDNAATLQDDDASVDNDPTVLLATLSAEIDDASEDL